MKSIIARLTPHDDKPVIFFPETKANGQIKCFLNGEEKMVGIDFYQATHHLDKEDAFKIAQAYAKHAHIASEELLVKQRLPKTVKPRATNDANLVMTPEQKKEEKGETLQQMAQELHDEGTKVKHDTKVEEAVKPLEELAKEFKKEETKKPAAKKAPAKKASPDNPEGATVKRSAEEKAKRPYNKKNTKRSEAAMKRYQAEIASVASQASETLMQPAPVGVPEDVQKAEMVKMVTAIVEALLKHKVM